MIAHVLPYPPFGHLLPLEKTGEGHCHSRFLPLLAREKVAEGRMREDVSHVHD
jgi:hypothetical protein